MLILIALATFVALSFGLFTLLRPSSEAAGIARRLPSAERTGPAPRVTGSFLGRAFRPRVRSLGRFLHALAPPSLVHRIERMLIEAGEPWSAPGFLTTWALVALGSVALTAWFAGVADLKPLQLLGTSLLLVVFPVLVPYALLRRKSKNRRKQITNALPDALDLLTACVESGMGSDAAFAVVTEKSRGPLADTFTDYMRQVGLGRPRRVALMDVAERTGVPDLVALAAAIQQGDELGTSLGDVLRRQAVELRLMRRTRAQIAAQRAPVLMTIPLALCFLPAMVAVVVVPAALNFMDFVQDLGKQ